MFELKDDVKMPGRRGGRKPKYPFADMEVGQSFEIPANGRTAASVYGARTNKKFATRKMEDGTFRCWRLK